MATEQLDFRIRTLIDAGNSAQTLGDLRDNLRELSNLAAEVGPNNTEAFNKITVAAGQTRDRIKDIRESVSALAGTPIERLTAGFSRLRQSIFEMDLEKFKLALTSIKDSSFALVGQLSQPFVNAGKALKGLILGTEQLTVALRAMGGALAATGIGLLVVTVGYLVAHFDRLKDSGGLLGTLFTSLGNALKKMEDALLNILDTLRIIDKERFLGGDASERGQKALLETKKMQEDLYKERENQYRREINRANELYKRDRERIELKYREAQINGENFNLQIARENELNAAQKKNLEDIKRIESERIRETTKFLLQQKDFPFSFKKGIVEDDKGRLTKIVLSRYNNMVLDLNQFFQNLNPKDFFTDKMREDYIKNYESFLINIDNGVYERRKGATSRTLGFQRELNKLKDDTGIIRRAIERELEIVLTKIYETPAATLEARKEQIVEGLKQNKFLTAFLNTDAKDFKEKLFNFFDETSLDISNSYNQAKDNLQLFLTGANVTIKELYAKRNAEQEAANAKLLEQELAFRKAASERLRQMQEASSKTLEDERIKTGEDEELRLAESEDARQQILKDRRDQELMDLYSRSKMTLDDDDNLKNALLINQKNYDDWKAESNRRNVEEWAAANQEMQNDANAVQEDITRKAQEEEDKRRILSQTRMQQSIEIGQRGLQLWANISDLYAARDAKRVKEGQISEEEAAKSNFERNKNLSTANAIVNTAAAIVAVNNSTAANSDPTGVVIRGVLMALVAGIGAAQVALIQSQEYESAGGVGSISTPAVPSLSPTQTVTPGQFFNPSDFKPGFTGDRRVYVVESDITGVQRKVQVVQNRSRF